MSALDDNPPMPEYRAVVREVTGRVWTDWVAWAVCPTLTITPTQRYRLMGVHRGVAIYDRLYGPEPA